MDSIKILGGGIAGLTAAINLKMAGIDVELYERRPYCGKHTRDFQFLENWTFDEDALKMLNNMQIKTDFYIKPWYSQEIISPSGRSYAGTSIKPLMYLIKRGRQPGSLDMSLEAQAHQHDVKLIYQSDTNPKDVDIVATGFRRPTFMATGIMFAIEHPDRSVVVFDDNLSRQMYSYFIVNDNLGEIVSINPVQEKNQKQKLHQTIQRFEQELGIEIGPKGEIFSAPVSFFFSPSANENGRHIVGEAAGFQDCLAGFGMLYAFKSGYFAAKSIIEGSDYDRLWQDDFLTPMRVSVSNREIFETLSNRGYETVIDVLNTDNLFIRKLLGGNDLRLILKKVYTYSIPQPLRSVLQTYRRRKIQIS